MPTDRVTPPPGPEVTLDGTVERITFYNPTNGFSVVRLRVRGRREPIAVVGTLPAAQPGEMLALRGRWQTDPRHGAQFRPSSAEVRRPSDIEGIVRYLGSGLVRQIGPVLAKRIVGTFGEQTLDVLDATPERVREVPGIGPQRARGIVAAWAEHRALRDVMAFLAEHGLDTRYAPRLLTAYGTDATRILSTNPYRLVADVPGLGFPSADRLGKDRGVRHTAPARVQAAVQAALLTASQSGHTRLARPALVDAAATVADVPPELAESGVAQLLAGSTIAVRRTEGGAAAAPGRAAPTPASSLPSSEATERRRPAPMERAAPPHYGAPTPTDPRPPGASPRCPTMEPLRCAGSPRPSSGEGSRLDVSPSPSQGGGGGGVGASRPESEGVTEGRGEKGARARVRLYTPADLTASSASAPSPDDDRLGIGLSGLVRAEEDLARRLLGLARRPGLPARRVERWLSADAESCGLSDEQRQAVATAATSGCFVLTGGPGVGKTTTTRALVRCLRALGRSVALAAPTGKAARRLGEVVGLEARTLHRLLGAGPGGFRHGTDDPLPFDVLIVDEASMLDTQLARAVVRAVGPGTQLILVGDADQLPSVGPGQMLRDILASGRVPSARLETVFRQAALSQIVTNAHRIRQGLLPEMAPPAALTRKDGGSDCVFVTAPPARVAGVAAEWAANRLPRLLGVPAGEVQAIAPLVRVCQTLNSMLQARLNPPRGQGERPHGALSLRVGDRVIQTHNNYLLGVFNGDTGTVVEIDGGAGLTVDFGDGRVVVYSAADVLDLDHAYGLTVHRAQGSEWPGVVVLASSSFGPILSRNLLYTALTRARRAVVVVGDEAAIAQAVARTRDQERVTGLPVLLQAGAVESPPALTASQEALTARPPLHPPSEATELQRSAPMGRAAPPYRRAPDFPWPLESDVPRGPLPPQPHGPAAGEGATDSLLPSPSGGEGLAVRGYQRGDRISPDDERDDPDEAARQAFVDDGTAYDPMPDDWPD